MKPALSLGDIIMEVLRKFSSILSNDAAGADKIDFVDFIDWISSMQNSSEKTNADFTIRRFSSIIYFVLYNSAIVKTQTEMTIQKPTSEKSEYINGAVGIK